MHSGLKTFLLLLLGLVLGLGLSLLLLFFVFRSTAGQAFIRSYIIAQNKWPSVEVTLLQSNASNSTTTSATASTTVSQALATSVVVFVPKVYASQEYAAAINAMVRNLQSFATSTNELGPLLIKINAQSLAGDFNGFFDLIVKAKVLVAEQRKISAQFAQTLIMLEASNRQTPDAITKSLTQTVIAAGTPVESDLTTYVGLLDQLLSGSVPSQELITSITASGQTLTKDMISFNSALAPLMKRFNDYIISHQGAAQ